MSTFSRKLIEHLRERKDLILTRVPFRGKGPGYTSDAGTWWPGDTETLGEYETIDFDLLVAEIDAFSKRFSEKGGQ